jgi:hypothetical protein
MDWKLGFARYVSLVLLMSASLKGQAREKCTIEFHDFVEVEQTDLTKELRLEIRNCDCPSATEGLRIKIDFLPMEQPEDMEFSMAGNPIYFDVPPRGKTATKIVGVTANRAGGPVRLVASVVNYEISHQGIDLTVEPDLKDVTLRF